MKGSLVKRKRRLQMARKLACGCGNRAAFRIYRRDGIVADACRYCAEFYASIRIE